MQFQNYKTEKLLYLLYPMEENTENEDLKKEAPKELKEPGSLYKKPNIRFFNSYEEQREEMYDYWASITYEQRMRNLLELMIASFGLSPEKLKNPGLINKIRIVKNDGYSA